MTATEEVCPSCDGDGDVVVAQDSAGDQWYETCWQCDGTGLVMVDG